MFKKLITFSFLIFLVSNNLNAAITVVGSSDAHICYKNAKYGYTTQSSIFTCLKAISEKTISKKDLDATRINLGIIYNNKSKPRMALEQFEIAFKNESMRAEEAYYPSAHTLTWNLRLHFRRAGKSATVIPRRLRDRRTFSHFSVGKQITPANTCQHLPTPSML